jgi:hypothetical protein
MGKALFLSRDRTDHEHTQYQEADERSVQVDHLLTSTKCPAIAAAAAIAGLTR